MKKKGKWTAALLCGLMITGMGATQIIPAIAKGECTCEITVHGSNCPLSKCTCEGKTTGEHTEGCLLYNKSGDLTVCICEPDIHAEGCPRYEAEGVLLEDTAADPEAADPALPDAPMESETPVDTPEPEPSEAPEPSPAPEETSEPTLTPEPAESETPEPVFTPEPEESTGATPNPENTPAAADPEEEPLDMTAPTDEPSEEAWEYPSGWLGYGEGQMRGNVLAAAEAFALDSALDGYIKEVRSAISGGGSARVMKNEDNFGDILAVYAVLTGQTADYPYGVSFDSEEDMEILHSVYWSMTQVTGLSNKGGAAISVKRLSAAQGAAVNGLSEAQKQEAVALAEREDTVHAIVSKSIFASLTDEEFETVCQQIPEGISAERRAVLMTAVSLEGKVDYFWGGKSLAYGWDDRWGEMRTVANEGSSTYGTARPLGLDCSGFVSWSFLNAFGQKDAIAGGSANQWDDSTEVAWEDARPGDLVFYHAPNTGSTNHVGIVLTVDETGPKTIVHCGSGGVKITGTEGFHHVRTPLIYE